jgi:hypothetical protein
MGKPLRVILKASTGAGIQIWLGDDGLFHVAREDVGGQPQICLGVDLFEVIAEMAELDLDDADQSNEALRLADQAQRGLRRPDFELEDEDEDELEGEDEDDEPSRASRS